jgi:hypothetical protein
MISHHLIKLLLDSLKFKSIGATSNIKIHMYPVLEVMMSIQIGIVSLDA